MLIIFLSCVALNVTGGADPSKFESWAISADGIANNQQNLLVPFAYPELQENGTYTAIGQAGGRNILVLFNMNTQKLAYANMDSTKAPDAPDPTAITYAGECTYKRHSSWNND